MAAVAQYDITASTVSALLCLFFTEIHLCVHGRHVYYHSQYSDSSSLFAFKDIHVCNHGSPGSGRHVCYRSQYSDCGSLLLERISGQHRL